VSGCTPADILTVLRMLRRGYPAYHPEIDVETAELWHGYLAEFAAPLVGAAVKLWIGREPRFPALAELLREVKELTREAARLEAARADNARMDRYKAEALADPLDDETRRMIAETAREMRERAARRRLEPPGPPGVTGTAETGSVPLDGQPAGPPADSGPGSGDNLGGG